MKENNVESLKKKFKSDTNLLENILTSLDASKFSRDWIARRVDIVMCQIDELPFASIGWIGSKHFNRSMRLYSDRELNYKLSSHGLFDKQKAI